MTPKGDKPTVDLAEWLLARIAAREALADRMEAASMHGIESSDEAAWFDAADPDLLRAECDAKRRIVEHCQNSMQGWRDDTDACMAEAESAITDLKYVLRLLALPFAGRPGYREEWRP